MSSHGVSITVPSGFYPHREGVSMTLMDAEVKGLHFAQNPVAFLSPKMAKRFAKYYEEPFAQYGVRVAHQIPAAIKVLGLNPWSRQAVVYFNELPMPWDTLPSAQQACINSLQLLTTPKGFITGVSQHRSMDMFKGFPYDAILMQSVIQRAADALGSIPGPLTMQIGDAHIYARDFDKVTEYEWRPCPSYRLAKRPAPDFDYLHTPELRFYKPSAVAIVDAIGETQHTLYEGHPLVPETEMAVEDDCGV